MQEQLVAVTEVAMVAMFAGITVFAGNLGPASAGLAKFFGAASDVDCSSRVGIVIPGIVMVVA